jgi:DNA-binding transcriptional MerR regulator
MATAAALQETPQIPDRLYFRMGDVCRLSGVKAHVLRYWEAEFPTLRPRKSGTNQRLYRRKDVEMVLEIKRLLYDQKYTLEGARACLERDRTKTRRPARPAAAPAEPVQANLFGTDLEWAATARAIRSELTAIVDLLS